MKTNGMDFLDWLHEIRRESEEERQRLGLSYAERLARAEQVADAVIEELASQPPVARDKPAKKPPRPGRRP
jgi:hypothetical protein